MRLFKRWTKQQCLDEILAIEQNLASNITSISQPTQGGITYKSTIEALQLIAHLEARVDEIDGVKPKNPIRRQVQWGQRPW